MSIDNRQQEEGFFEGLSNGFVSRLNDYKAIYAAMAGKIGFKNKERQLYDEIHEDDREAHSKKSTIRGSVGEFIGHNSLDAVALLGSLFTGGATEAAAEAASTAGTLARTAKATKILKNVVSSPTAMLGTMSGVTAAGSSIKRQDKKGEDVSLVSAGLQGVTSGLLSAYVLKRLDKALEISPEDILAKKMSPFRRAAGVAGEFALGGALTSGNTEVNKAMSGDSNGLGDALYNVAVSSAIGGALGGVTSLGNEFFKTASTLKAKAKADKAKAETGATKPKPKRQDRQAHQIFDNATAENKPSLNKGHDNAIQKLNEAEKPARHAKEAHQTFDNATAENKPSLNKEHDNAIQKVNEAGNKQPNNEEAPTDSSTEKTANQTKQAHQIFDNATAENKPSLNKEHDNAVQKLNEAEKPTRHVKEAHQTFDNATAENKPSLNKEHDNAIQKVNEAGNKQPNNEEAPTDSSTEKTANQTKQAHQIFDNATAENKPNLNKEHDNPIQKVNEAGESQPRAEEPKAEEPKAEEPTDNKKILKTPEAKKTKHVLKNAKGLSHDFKAHITSDEHLPKTMTFLSLLPEKLTPQAFDKALVDSGLEASLKDTHANYKPKLRSLVKQYRRSNVYKKTLQNNNIPLSIKRNNTPLKAKEKQSFEQKVNSDGVKGRADLFLSLLPEKVTVENFNHAIHASGIGRALKKDFPNYQKHLLELLKKDRKLKAQNNIPVKAPEFNKQFTDVISKPNVRRHLDKFYSVLPEEVNDYTIGQALEKSGLHDQLGTHKDDLRQLIDLQRKASPFNAESHAEALEKLEGGSTSASEAQTENTTVTPEAEPQAKEKNIQRTSEKLNDKTFSETADSDIHGYLDEENRRLNKVHRKATLSELNYNKRNQITKENRVSLPISKNGFAKVSDANLTEYTAHGKPVRFSLAGDGQLSLSSLKTDIAELSKAMAEKGYYNVRGAALDTMLDRNIPDSVARQIVEDGLQFYPKEAYPIKKPIYRGKEKINGEDLLKSSGHKKASGEQFYSRKAWQKTIQPERTHAERIPGEQRVSPSIPTAEENAALEARSSNKNDDGIPQSAEPLNRTEQQRKETVYLDLETTGKDVHTDEPLQIAVIDDDGNSLMYSHIKPKNKTSWEEAQQIHGITPEDVANAPSFDDLHEELSELLKDKVVVIYNKDFDSAFMPEALKNAKDVRCAMKMFSQHYGKWKWGSTNYKYAKLTDAAEHVNHDLSNAHDALGDTLATRSVYHYTAYENELKTYRESQRNPRNIQAGQTAENTMEVKNPIKQNYKRIASRNKREAGFSEKAKIQLRKQDINTAFTKDFNKLEKHETIDLGLSKESFNNVKRLIEKKKAGKQLSKIDQVRFEFVSQAIENSSKEINTNFNNELSKVVNEVENLVKIKDTMEFSGEKESGISIGNAVEEGAKRAAFAEPNNTGSVETFGSTTLQEMNDYVTYNKLPETNTQHTYEGLTKGTKINVSKEASTASRGRKKEMDSNGDEYSLDDRISNYLYSNSFVGASIVEPEVLLLNTASDVASTLMPLKRISANNQNLIEGYKNYVTTMFPHLQTNPVFKETSFVNDLGKKVKYRVLDGIEVTQKEFGSINNAKEEALRLMKMFPSDVFRVVKTSEAVEATGVNTRIVPESEAAKTQTYSLIRHTRKEAVSAASKQKKHLIEMIARAKRKSASATSYIDKKKHEMDLLQMAIDKVDPHTIEGNSNRSRLKEYSELKPAVLKKKLQKVQQEAQEFLEDSEKTTLNFTMYTDKVSGNDVQISLNTADITSLGRKSFEAHGVEKVLEKTPAENFNEGMLTLSSRGFKLNQEMPRELFVDYSKKHKYRTTEQIEADRLKLRLGKHITEAPGSVLEKKSDYSQTTPLDDAKSFIKKNNEPLKKNENGVYELRFADREISEKDPELVKAYRGIAHHYNKLVNKLKESKIAIQKARTPEETSAINSRTRQLEDKIKDLDNQLNSSSNRSETAFENMSSKEKLSSMKDDIKRMNDIADSKSLSAAKSELAELDKLTSQISNKLDSTADYRIKVLAKKINNFKSKYDMHGTPTKSRVLEFNAKKAKAKKALAESRVKERELVKENAALDRKKQITEAQLAKTKEKFDKKISRAAEKEDLIQEKERLIVKHNNELDKIKARKSELNNKSEEINAAIEENTTFLNESHEKTEIHHLEDSKRLAEQELEDLKAQDYRLDGFSEIPSFQEFIYELARGTEAHSNHSTYGLPNLVKAMELHEELLAHSGDLSKPVTKTIKDNIYLTDLKKSLVSPYEPEIVAGLPKERQYRGIMGEASEDGLELDSPGRNSYGETKAREFDDTGERIVYLSRETDILNNPKNNKVYTEKDVSTGRQSKSIPVKPRHDTVRFLDANINHHEQGLYTEIVDKLGVKSKTNIMSYDTYKTMFKDGFFSKNHVPIKQIKNGAYFTDAAENEIYIVMKKSTGDSLENSKENLYIFSHEFSHALEDSLLNRIMLTNKPKSFNKFVSKSNLLEEQPANRIPEDTTLENSDKKFVHFKSEFDNFRNVIEGYNVKDVLLGASDLQVTAKQIQDVREDFVNAFATELYNKYKFSLLSRQQKNLFKIQRNAVENKIDSILRKNRLSLGSNTGKQLESVRQMPGATDSLSFSSNSEMNKFLNPTEGFRNMLNSDEFARNPVGLNIKTTEKPMFLGENTESLSEKAPNVLNETVGKILYTTNDRLAEIDKPFAKILTSEPHEASNIVNQYQHEEFRNITDSLDNSIVKNTNLMTNKILKTKNSKGLSIAEMSDKKYGMLSPKKSIKKEYQGELEEALLDILTNKKSKTKVGEALQNGMKDTVNEYVTKNNSSTGNQEVVPVMPIYETARVQRNHKAIKNEFYKIKSKNTKKALDEALATNHISKANYDSMLEKSKIYNKEYTDKHITSIYNKEDALKNFNSFELPTRNEFLNLDTSPTLKDPEFMKYMMDNNYINKDPVLTVNRSAALTVRNVEFSKRFGGYAAIDPLAKDSATVERITKSFAENMAKMPVYDFSKLLEAEAKKRAGENVSTYKEALENGYLGLKDKLGYWVKTVDKLFDKETGLKTEVMFEELKKAGFVRDADNNVITSATNASDVHFLYDPTINLTHHLGNIEIQKGLQQKENAIKLMKGILQRRPDTLNSFLKTGQSVLLSYGNTLKLGLSMLSSLPEIVGAAIKQSTAKDMFTGLKDVVSQVYKSFNSKTRNEMTQEAINLGLISENFVSSSIGQMIDSTGLEKGSEKAMDILFHLNQQENWVKYIQGINLQVSKNIIKEWGRRALTGSGAAKETAIKDLARFGIDANDLANWDGVIKDGFDLIKENTPENIARKKIQDGLFKFNEEAVVRASQNHKPYWANDSRFALLWNLKSYIYAHYHKLVKPFYKSILGDVKDQHAAFKARKGNTNDGFDKGFVFSNEMLKGMGSAGAKATAGAMAFLPLAGLGWYIRELIQYSSFGQQRPSSKNSTAYNLYEATERAGLLGIATMGHHLVTSPSPLPEKVAGVISPTAGHAARLIRPRSDKLASFAGEKTAKEVNNTMKLMSLVPLVNQLPGLKMKVAKDITQKELARRKNRKQNGNYRRSSE